MCDSEPASHSHLLSRAVPLAWTKSASQGCSTKVRAAALLLSRQPDRCREDARLKKVWLLGTLPRGALSEDGGSASPAALRDRADDSQPDDRPEDPAIIILERLPFAADSVERLLSKRVEHLKQTDSNDIYSWRSAVLAASQDDPDVKINVTCPCTDRVCPPPTPVGVSPADHLRSTSPSTRSKGAI